MKYNYIETKNEISDYHFRFINKQSFLRSYLVFAFIINTIIIAFIINTIIFAFIINTILSFMSTLKEES